MLTACENIVLEVVVGKKLACKSNVKQVVQVAVSDHRFDHLQLRTMWKIWLRQYKKARISDEKAAKMREKQRKNQLGAVWDVDAAGSNPVTPTRKLASSRFFRLLAFLF